MPYVDFVRFGILVFTVRGRASAIWQFRHHRLNLVRARGGWRIGGVMLMGDDVSSVEENEVL